MTALRRLAPAGLALAAMAAQAQFSIQPLPQPRSAPLASEALNEMAYRKDAGRHFYSDLVHKSGRFQVDSPTEGQR